MEAYLHLILLPIYPTLLELCGLPSYERNEGVSLVEQMKKKDQEEAEQVAITTYGMKNHAVRSRQFRYIQYEDGSEEFYDHQLDSNEWYNQAANPQYLNDKEDLKIRLPELNAKWDINSSYDMQPYFKEQKRRTSVVK